MTYHHSGTPVRKNGGYVLYFVLGSLAVLSFVAGQIIVRVRDSYRAIHRAANWQQALTTADAGVDIALAQITSVLPDVRVNPEETVGLSVPPGIVSSLSTGLTLSPGANGLPLNASVTLTPPPLITHGEGNTTQLANVSIEVRPVDSVPTTLSGLGEVSLQLIRIRSTGVAYLDVSRTAGYEKEENELRRPVLVWDRTTQQQADRPYVARTIEVTVRPALPFQTGMISQGEFRVDSDQAVFDSFNSVTSTASTAGRYDVAKRLQNVTLQSNSADFTMPGYVYGNVFTNGANVEKTSRISGLVENDRYQSAPPLRSPTWIGNPLAPASVLAPTSLAAGSAMFPARYKFDNVTSDLHITRGSFGLATHVDIWVSGDFTGKLILDDGVKARVYVEGDINTAAGAWQNEGHRAQDLQIYGLKPEPGKGWMTFDLSTDMEATIYAPEHALVFSGSGNFSGAVTGASVRVKNCGKFHYDEALALNTGPVIGFELVSWKEILPQ
jgi:hypothetical protein